MEHGLAHVTYILNVGSPEYTGEPTVKCRSQMKLSNSIFCSLPQIKINRVLGHSTQRLRSTNLHFTYLLTCLYWTSTCLCQRPPSLTIVLFYLLEIFVDHANNNSFGFSLTGLLSSYSMLVWRSFVYCWSRIITWIVAFLQILLFLSLFNWSLLDLTMR